MLMGGSFRKHGEITNAYRNKQSFPYIKKTGSFYNTFRIEAFNHLPGDLPFLNSASEKDSLNMLI